MDIWAEVVSLSFLIALHQLHDLQREEQSSRRLGALRSCDREINRPKGLSWFTRGGARIRIGPRPNLCPCQLGSNNHLIFQTYRITAQPSTGFPSFNLG